MNMIERIKQTISLPEYLDRVGFKLQKSSSAGSHKIVCPFHDDHDPSCEVSSERYKCWSCDAKGDIIEFVKKWKNLSVSEAIGDICKDIGMEYVGEEKNDNDSELHKATWWASFLYQEQIKKDHNKSKLQYLKKRGITDEAIEAFRVGYAPPKNFLLKRVKQNHESFVSLDLIKSKEDRQFDMFQNRIMFPFLDIKGNTLGFGGRTMLQKEEGQEDKYIKYLNSSASEIFDKSNLVFGEYQLRQHYKGTKPDKIYVFEGYMDVIACHSVGIYNCVCVCGTALTDKQLQRLYALTDHVVLVFDGDKAGKRALDRSIETVLRQISLTKYCSYVKLPENMDPADYIEHGNIEQLKSKLAIAQGYEHYLILKLSEKSRENNWPLESVFRRICLLESELTSLLDEVCPKIYPLLKDHIKCQLKIS